MYLRGLKELKSKKVEVVSSGEIAKLLGVNPAQFRKDLSYFGEFGKRGVGYYIEGLIEKIEDILGINKQWKIALAGVGRLGEALLNFEGFSKFNLKIVSAFDCDKRKVGKFVNNVKIEDIKTVKAAIKKRNIKIGVISTIPSVAQSVAQDMVEGGVKGILNFAPVTLKLPADVFVVNVDMACELEALVFFIKEHSFADKNK